MMAGVRRSLLYVPGDSERMLNKAAELPADMLLLNLEDGVSAGLKDEARSNVCRALRSVDFGNREVIVRINAVGSPAGQQDLAAVVPLNPDGICVPKVEKAETMRDLDLPLARLERAAGIEPGTVRLHAMIESPRGVVRCPEIASASPRMSALIFGSADFAAEARCRPGEDRLELLLVLQSIVLAARAGGIDAIDSPCFNLWDAGILERECAQARRLGFDGKSALHPGQLDVINRAFAVSPEELAWAQRILGELQSAEERGRALSTLDGQLIDDPHRKAAEAILRRAQRTAG